MPLDLKKLVRTRDGQEVDLILDTGWSNTHPIVAILKGDIHVRSFTREGIWSVDGETTSPIDLINVKTKHTGWIALRPPGSSESTTALGWTTHAYRYKEEVQHVVCCSAWSDAVIIPIEWEE